MRDQYISHIILVPLPCKNNRITVEQRYMNVSSTKHILWVAILSILQIFCDVTEHSEYRHLSWKVTYLLRDFLYACNLQCSVSWSLSAHVAYVSATDASALWQIAGLCTCNELIILKLQRCHFYPQPSRHTTACCTLIKYISTTSETTLHEGRKWEWVPVQ